MLLMPSIDLRGGHCVRLRQGDFSAETRYALDPLDLLKRFGHPPQMAFTVIFLMAR